MRPMLHSHRIVPLWKTYQPNINTMDDPNVVDVEVVPAAPAEPAVQPTEATPAGAAEGAAEVVGE